MTRSTLAESVAGALRHAIFQGAYLGGERLVELTIAQEMNVSQNTVRDALRLLEKDGLVVKRPVTAPTSDLILPTKPRNCMRCGPP